MLIRSNKKARTSRAFLLQYQVTFQLAIYFPAMASSLSALIIWPLRPDSLPFLP